MQNNVTETLTHKHGFIAPRLELIQEHSNACKTVRFEKHIQKAFLIQDYDLVGWFFQEKTSLNQFGGTTLAGYIYIYIYWNSQTSHNSVVYPISHSKYN